MQARSIVPFPGHDTTERTYDLSVTGPERAEIAAERPMANSKAATVEEYLAELPEERRAVVTAVRKLILANLPDGYRISRVPEYLRRR